MYHMCNMLYFREEIIKKFGDIQFDSLDAEEIIEGLWRQVKSTIEEEFSFVDVSRLICIVKCACRIEGISSTKSPKIL